VAPSDRPVFLVGFMGSGKSSVGRALARSLGWAYVDTDEMVESEEQRSIERIFEESGEGYFREAESKALSSLSGRRRLVVATGGGLFLGRLQREFMRREGRTVWLDVPLDLIEARVRRGGDRPLWPRHDPLERRLFYDRRRAAYALAEVRVDGASGGVDQIAQTVFRRLWPQGH
jgi:shikimate kinase